MQSRKDQVQAYFFVVGRTVSALLRGDPDASETPTRRFATGVLGGVLVAALIVAGFGVYGLIVPGGQHTWKKPGSIIVEEETGASYLYLEEQLRPVLNYASARLVAGGQGELRTVSRNSLAGVGHGPPIGIPGAPDALPDPKKQNKDPWVICASLGTDQTGARRPLVGLRVGGAAPVRALNERQALLVKTPDDVVYLVWRDRRFRFANAAALTALGYSGGRAFPVDAAWISSVPIGRDLAAADVPDRGKAGPALGPAGASTIGQVYRVRNAGTGRDEYYLVRSDGLSPLSRTDAALLIGDPRNAGVYPRGQGGPLELPAAALATVPRSAVNSVTEGYPAEPPVQEQSVDSGPVPCLRFAIGPANGPTVEVAVADRRDEFDGVRASGPRAGGAADKVVVDPGGGLLVRALPAPGVPDGTLYLITDLGAKFPLADAKAAESLGFTVAEAVAVPTQLLALLPTGPALDPVAAQASQPVVGSPPAGSGPG